MNYSQEFCYDQAGRLICERKYSEYYQTPSTSDKIVYLYDADSIIGIVYTENGETDTYYFQRNLFGDVVGIYDVNGTKVGGYAYDAWEKCTITLNTKSVVTRNPIRYRGYYYDQDTKLYYLNARYYSPEWRRFISPDDTAYLDFETPNGLNLYVYCGNNPVMNTDPNGTFMLSSFLLGLGIAAAIGTGVGAVSYVASEAISFVITGEWTWSWGMFAGSVLGGAIGGAISFLFPGIGLTGGAFITGVLSTSIGMGLENAFGEANHSIGNIIFNSLLNGVLSAGFAKLTSLIKIPKFTGRGSISQVARQMNTKFYRGRKVGHIKLKTFMKLGAYESAYSVFTTIVSGLLDAFEYFRNIDKYAIPGQFPGI